MNNLQDYMKPDVSFIRQPLHQGGGPLTGLLSFFLFMRICHQNYKKKVHEFQSGKSIYCQILTGYSISLSIDVLFTKKPRCEINVHQKTIYKNTFKKLKSEHCSTTSVCLFLPNRNLHAFSCMRTKTYPVTEIFPYLILHNYV
jgi:hypothetical protein